MFDPDDQSKAKRPRSLLSLSPAAQAPATLPDAQPAPHPADHASERHHVARPERRAVRGSRLWALKDAEEIRQPPPEPESTSHQGNDAAPGFYGRLRERLTGGAKTAAEDVTPSTHKPPSVPAPAPAQPIHSPYAEADGRDQYWRPLIDPLQVIGGVWSSKKLIVATTLAGAVIGVAVALSTPKKYESTAELLVDPRELKIVERDLTATGLPSDGTLAIVENQARVLVSGNVLTKVVDQLNLAADPEFNGQSGEFSIRGLISELRSIFTRAESDGDVRRALAINNLAESVEAERSEKTFVISVTASTRDADKSALIANTMTDVFLQTYGQIQANTAGRATDELTARLSELQAGVEAAERAVERFKAENDIIDAQGRLITDDEIVKLNDQLSIARARTIELNARAASARGLDVDAVLAGTLPEQVASPVMTALRTQYATLKQEVDRLSVRLGPRHPQRLAADAQLDGAREQLQIELRRINQSVQIDLQRAVQLEQDLAARLARLKAGQADLNEEMVTLRELERDASSKRSVYEAYLLRARETGEQQSLNTANVSVISKATPALTPSGPSRSMIAIVGAFMGFLAGIALGGARGAVASLRESGRRADRSEYRHPQPVRAREEIRTLAHELPRQPAPLPAEPPYPSYPQMQTSLYPRGRAVYEPDPYFHRPGPPPLFDPRDWPDEPSHTAARPVDDIRAHLREVREAVYDLAASRSVRRRY